MLSSPSRLLPGLLVAATLACQPTSQPTPEAAPAREQDPPPPGKPRPTDATDPGAWSFEFKDPPAGARAPLYNAFGVTLGTTMFTATADMVRDHGLDCGDTSIRAMMDRRREKEQKRLDAAKSNGDGKGEDAVTAASWMNRRSKREANPQVRFSCPKISAEQLGDRPRKPSTGRLLYVFDSLEHPVRHASYQRTHQNHASALADFKDTVDALTKAYGPPTKPLKGDLPTPDQTGAVDFPSAVNFEVSWEYADLLVRTNILRYGKLVTVGERVEVPHGLRPDAPTVGPGAKPPTPATPLAPAPTRAPDATAPDVKAPAKADTGSPAKPAKNPPAPTDVPSKPTK